MASDDFNRANETPLAPPWVKAFGADFNLVSNAVQGTTSANSLWYYNGSASSADQFSEATMASAVPGNDWGPAVRVGGAGDQDCYFFDQYNGAGGGLSKFVAGQFSTITTGGSPIATGDSQRIEVEGSAIRGYVNGTQKHSATDTSISGQGDGAGLFIYEAGGAIDNWSGGDLGGGSSVTGSAALTGVGSLTSSARRGRLGVAALTGAGTISASGTRIVVATAALVGSGLLDAVGVRTVLGAADLQGAGSLFVALGAVLGAANLTSSGVLTANGVRETFGDAALSGLGSLSASGTRIVLGAADLAALGVLSSDGRSTVLGAAVLAATGSLNATGTRIVIGLADLVAVGVLSASGVRETFGAAALTGDGSLAVVVDVAPNFRGPTSVDIVVWLATAELASNLNTMDLAPSGATADIKPNNSTAELS